MPFAGNEITLYDFTKPVRERHEGPCGPYLWRVPDPTQKQTGRGFYLDTGTTLLRNIQCDGRGSSFRLRLAYANEALRCALSRVTGYYADDEGDTTLEPIIAQLNHGRGFLPGWTMGEGMASRLDYSTIYAKAADAARAAHSMAETDAEREREYQARERAREEREAREHDARIVRDAIDTLRAALPDDDELAHGALEIVEMQLRASADA